MKAPNLIEQMRADELQALLKKHNYLYHTLDAPQVSDAQYDAWFKELRTLEENYPSLIRQESPSKQIGGEVLSSLETARHSQRMYSLDNVFNDEEWADFWQRLLRILPQAKPIFWCDPKLDGLAVELIYEQGQYTAALTRGDGEVGELITAAMATVKNIPKKLQGSNIPDVLEVRGEVIISKADFQALNQRQEAAGLKAFANPRNAAAGSVRQLDISVAAQRPLQFMAYGIGRVEFGTYSAWESYSQLMQRLKDFGFATPPFGCVCGDQVEVLKFCADLENRRDNLPMDIDGAVIKLNDLEAQNILGYTARAPRFAVARKFPPKQAQTILEKIVIQVGRTGVLTPIAELKPVNVGGVNVSRATLHNEDEIKAKDVREQDVVIIQRAGDVIPEIVGPILSERKLGSQPYIFPTICPSCEEEAVRLPGEAAWRCINLSCSAKLRETLVHFVSKAGLDIDGVGRKWVEQLADSGKIKSPADLFELTAEDLLNYERMGEKSATNFVAALNLARQNTSLVRLLCALGIRHVGEQTARTLAEKFSNLQALSQASFDSLQELPDIGPEVAASINSFFHDHKNQALLEHFRALGLDPQSKPTEVIGPLAAKSFLFTGTLSMPRSQAQNMAVQAGAKIASSVGKTLDYLVVGENPGSKLDKAVKLGVTVLSEQDFLTLFEKNLS